MRYERLDGTVAAPHVVRICGGEVAVSKPAKTLRKNHLQLTCCEPRTGVLVQVCGGCDGRYRPVGLNSP